MKNKSLLLVSVIILYAIGVCISCALVYQNSKQTLLTIIDQSLEENSHRFLKSPSQKQSSFSELIKSRKMAHIRGLAEFFSVYKQEFNSNKFIELYASEDLSVDIKKEIEKILNVNFDASSSVFFDYIKSSNKFRVAAVPYIDELGDIYVIVSGDNVDFIYQTLIQNLNIMLLVFSILLFVIIPLIIKYKNNYKTQWLKKIKDSNKDSVTGVPNQQQLIYDLEKSQNPNLAFIKIMNYNGFINQYGPAVTDSIAKQFATVLSHYEDSRLQKSSIYRVQQSTFAILEDQDIELKDIADITGQIVKSLVTNDYLVGDNEYIKLNVTVGSVRQKKDAFTLANMALSEAIDKGIPFFLIDKGEKFLPESYKRDQEIVKQLRLAINENRLKPFFQPIFDAKSLKVVKYESLARIVDENNKPMIAPNVFLALAAREKLNYKITRIIVAKSVQFAIENNLIVSINLSIADINNKTTREFIYSSVKNSGVSQLLHFELLENEAIVDSENVLKFIAMIQKLGSEIGMDDLGKGYSNIERLMNLPVNFVKLDRSIMEHIAENLEIQNITKGIIKLAHKKNLSVTAEFCANKRITDMAIMLGVDYLQGFYFAEAGPESYMPPE